MPRRPAYSIRDEARKLAKLSTDIDLFRDRYYQVDPVNNISVTFPSFGIRTFDKSLFKLLHKSEKKEFKAKWIMRPWIPSEEYLNTPIYWQLIMYINFCDLMEDFKDYDYIYVPNINDILDLVRAKDVDNNLLPLIDPPMPNFKARTYYKDYPLNPEELSRIIANKTILNLNDTTTATTPVIESKNITIEINSLHIVNKYLDLPDIPDSTNTLIIKYNNYSLPLRYGYDYILKNNSNSELLRISWDVNDILNSGLITSLEEDSGIREYITSGDSFKIEYTTTV